MPTTTRHKQPAAQTSRARSGGPTDSARGAAPAVDRQAAIARAAYLNAQQRGFEPGHELDDWLQAERDYDGNGR